jgi:parallel beta-helix repeat protein
VDEATVVGNTIVGNNQQGIFLNSAYYCTVTGNGVVTNAGGMPASTAAGITVAGSYNAITGNTSTNNDGAATQSYGIIEPAGNNNCVVGNSTVNNAVAAISVSGANTNMQANQPVITEKLYYADIISSYTTPSTTGIPNGSLWLDPTVGALYVLQGGAWTAK